MPIMPFACGTVGRMSCNTVCHQDEFDSSDLKLTLDQDACVLPSFVTLVVRRPAVAPAQECMHKPQEANAAILFSLEWGAVNCFLGKVSNPK